jgi:uncharacterized SAM-binding protein YcdF (DUF218 family)
MTWSIFEPDRWIARFASVRPIRGRALRNGAVMLVAVGLLDLAACGTLYAVSLVAWPDSRSALPPGAPLVVFYSSLESDRSARITAAVEAYQTFGPRRVLCVGGSRPEQARFGAEDVAAELARRGLPPGMIASERHSFDTSTNIEAALALAPGASALVFISDRLHLMRTLLEVQRQAPAIAAIALPSPGPAGVSLIWWRLHYEMVAWAGMILPDPFRRSLIRTVRI